MGWTRCSTPPSSREPACRSRSRSRSGEPGVISSWEANGSNYERKVQSSETFIEVAMIRLILKRLAREV
jgi:hypothetical protein